MRPMPSGARLMLFANAFAGMPCCSATLITTEASSRMAAIPEPSLAPDRKTSAGRPVSSKPMLAAMVALPMTIVSVIALRRWGSRRR